MAHLAEGAPDNGDGYEEGDHIADGLAHRHAHESEEMGHDEDEGDEHKSLARGGEHVGTEGLASGLEHHVARHDVGVERIDGKMPAKGCAAYRHHYGVVAEEGYGGFGKAEHHGGDEQEEEEACAHGEPEALAQPVVETCSVAIAAEGLKTLAQAHYHRHDKHRDTAHYRHGCHSGVAIGGGCKIEQHHGDACQALARERGRTAIHYLAHIMPARRETAKTHAYACGTEAAAHNKKNEETDRLSEDCGKGGTAQSKAKAEDEQGVEHDIEQHATHYAPHGMAGVALHTQLAVEGEGGYLEGGAEQYYGEILLGEGEDGGGAAKPQRQTTGIKKSRRGNENACHDGIDESGGCHRRGIAYALCPKLARHVAAAAMTEE